MLDQALEWLLEEEGGWSDHPADRGGKTMYGVTQGTYTAWRKKRGRPEASVRSLSKAEAREIYENEYWNAAGCDSIITLIKTLDVISVQVTAVLAFGQNASSAQVQMVTLVQPRRLMSLLTMVSLVMLARATQNSVLTITSEHSLLRQV